MNDVRASLPSPIGFDPQRGGRCMAWQTALLCIDLQHLNCCDGYGQLADYAAAGLIRKDVDTYLSRVDELMLPNVRRLQEAFRRGECEVIHIRIQSLTLDGRDRSVEHKKLGLHAPENSTAAAFMPEVAPIDNEIVINKTASGVFVSTNLEYVLRNLCVSKIFVVGVYTNECISSAVRSSSDLGFEVSLVADATAAMTRELHDATLTTTHERYARVLSTTDVLAEISDARQHPG